MNFIIVFLSYTMEWNKENVLELTGKVLQKAFATEC
jgi:hypothetical protein